MDAPAALDRRRLVAPAVRLERVTAGYGARPVLREVSLRVEPGELVGVVGPSGVGKTTLLRAILGRADRHAGMLEVFGRPPSARGVPEVGYVSQLGATDPDFPLTVEQVVLLGGTATSAPTPWFSRAERRAAREVLERLGIGGLAREPIHALSGGQRQRMLVARALVRRPRLLLLDEPTSGVDVATRREVLGLVEALNLDGLTVVLTTHDLNHVAAYLPRIVCLARHVVADGAPSDVLTPAVLAETFGAPMRVIHEGGRVVVVDEPAFSPPAAAPLEGAERLPFVRAVP
jgi:zinc/manganese transport system ATP-binding protein